jgi:hypothetical protein
MLCIARWDWAGIGSCGRTIDWESYQRCLRAQRDRMYLSRAQLAPSQHPRDAPKNPPSPPSPALKLSYSKATKQTSCTLTHPRPTRDPEKGHVTTSGARDQACDLLVPKPSRDQSQVTSRTKSLVTPLTQSGDRIRFGRATRPLVNTWKTVQRTREPAIAIAGLRAIRHWMTHSNSVRSTDTAPRYKPQPMELQEVSKKE